MIPQMENLHAVKFDFKPQFLTQTRRKKVSATGDLLLSGLLFLSNRELPYV
jgi:hypothetical protein